MAPASSKKKKRCPCTPSFLKAVCAQLKIDSPDAELLHIAVYTCTTTCFYSAARLGEFTIPTLTGFNPLIHVKPSDVLAFKDRAGLPTMSFFLSQTKSAVYRESVSWAAQSDETDPKAALESHLRINGPAPNGPLFAYKNKKEKATPLTKKKLIKVLTRAAKAANLEPLQGHGIHIGATLEYLIRGVPFEVMKAIGWWSSDAFYSYLSKHEQILVLYLQAVPSLHELFLRLTLTFRR